MDDQSQDQQQDKQPEQQQSPHVEPFSWSASEYIDHEKNTGWYALLFGGGVILVILVFVVTRDILASIVVLMSVSAMGVYAGRKPSTKQLALDDNGVRVNDKSYAYSEFRSFSVVEEGRFDSIWLRPNRRFAPNVVMYFSPDDEERIIGIVSQFLPHEERELDSIDRASKRIRF